MTAIYREYSIYIHVCIYIYIWYPLWFGHPILSVYLHYFIIIPWLFFYWKTLYYTAVGGNNCDKLFSHIPSCLQIGFCHWFQWLDLFLSRRRTNPGRHHLQYPHTIYTLLFFYHYNYVIMSAMASQITSLTIVYSTFFQGANRRKHQGSASLAFERGIYGWPLKRAGNAENVSIWWRHQ